MFKKKNDVHLSPTYKQILEEIGSQLKERKGALMKRTLLISWPILVLIAGSYAVDYLNDLGRITETQIGWLIVVGIVWGVFSIVYSSVMTFIFEIEKQIWIDSFFDKKKLELKESWTIAKKLFWPGFLYRFKLGFQYYFLPILIGLVILALVIFGLLEVFSEALDASFGVYLAIFIAPIIIGLIGLTVYTYYVRVKLRYSWFIFLDSYGHATTYKDMLNTMNTLNEISKSDSFKKSLVAAIGTDSIRDLTNAAISTISYGISHFGKAGEALGSMVNAYGKEAARQIASYANISAQYILYKAARKELHGESGEQHENQAVYNLK